MSWIGTTEADPANAGTPPSFAVPRRLLLEVERVFLRRWGVAATIALALTLLIPCVSTPLVADDLLHQLMLRHEGGIPGLARHPLDLFRFADGSPESVRMLVDAGMFPWWADPQVRLAFFRPFASFTHWLDYRLWPELPVAMHLHSMLWYALLLAVVADVYRRFATTSRTALLALLLFAVDDAHAPVVGWVANRNLIIALALSLPALLLHDQRRRDGSALAAWLAPFVLFCGLCAGEGALVAVAYLIAYAIVLERGSFASRLATLWPYAIVLLAWRLGSGLLGYGVLGSGLYIDPLASPLAFGRALAERLPVLLLGQLALPWADFWELYPLTFPALRKAVLAFAYAVLAGFVALAWPLLRESAQARFWALGSVLATLVMCATFPHDRLLLGVGLGAMALVAELLRRGVAASASAWQRRSAVALGAIHLVLGPLLLSLRAAHVADLNGALNSASQSLSVTPAIEERSIVLLNPPIDPFAAYVPIYREAAGLRRPKHVLWLATGVTELTLTNVDARTIRLRARDGFLSSTSQLMLRDLQRPLALGARVELEMACLQVTSVTADGRPLEIQVRFRDAIPSSDLVWMRWAGRGYSPFALPAEGASIVIPAVDVTNALFG